MNGNSRPDLALFPDEVTVRCAPCHNRGRSAPAMAILALLNDHWSAWRLDERFNTRLARDLGSMQAAADGKMSVWRDQAGQITGYVRGRTSWDVLNLRQGEPFELVCRQYGHRRRIKPIDLLVEAHQALEEDRREIFV